MPGVGLVELDECNDEEKLQVEFYKEYYGVTHLLPAWAQRAVFDAWLDQREEAAEAEQAMAHLDPEWSDAEPPTEDVEWNDAGDLVPTAAPVDDAEQGGPQ